jgi:tRNA-(ms[2]io[6]A)-hydroxylase
VDLSTVDNTKSLQDMGTSLRPQYELCQPTPKAWLDGVFKNFDRFLQDHAACERKASALAMSLTARYADHPELVDMMIGLAREELEHFHEVTKIIHGRGMMLSADEPDQYVNALLAKARHGRRERFLDRLLISSVIEARGHERLEMVAQALPEGELKDFYTRLSASESGHKRIFLRLAELYFDAEETDRRYREFLEYESEAMLAAPCNGNFH